MRIPNGHVVPVSHEAVKRRRPSCRRTYFIKWTISAKNCLRSTHLLRVVQTLATLFLKSMSEKVGSDIENELWTYELRLCPLLLSRIFPWVWTTLKKHYLDSLLKISHFSFNHSWWKVSTKIESKVLLKSLLICIGSILVLEYVPPVAMRLLWFSLFKLKLLIHGGTILIISCFQKNLNSIIIKYFFYTQFTVKLRFFLELWFSTMFT